jgi:hypothetical protein
MKLFGNFRTYLVAASLILASALLLLFALPAKSSLANSARVTKSPAQADQHDGQRDFDFHFGNWHTHIRRLQHPLSGSSSWYEMDGTLKVGKIWDGRGNIEEVEADGPNGHFEGMSLFLYNPQAHQWAEYFSNSKVGTIGVPLVGEFKNGRGEFYDQEDFNGRSILVRAIWSDITPDSHHFEQSFSDDGGKTWEPNFTASLTRLKD